jgi:hypothetical protein
MMRRSRTVGFAVAAITVAAPVAVALTASAPAAAAPRQVPAAHHAPVHVDFDGDGKADLVVSATGSGRVRVSYSKAKPGGSHTQWISAPETASYGFGSALAVGDFNGDGFADLAIGAPGFSDNMDDTEQGAVFIYAGSKTGLHYTGVAFKGPDDFDDDNELGAALAAGDVNSDGFADLVMGNPGPEGGGDGTGSVRIVFGSSAGLTTAGETGMGSPSPAEEGNFGASVALADVNGDGDKDLLVGEPGGGPALPTDATTHSGDIQVFYGTASGIGPTHQTFLGSTMGAAGALGSSIAVGDINHDGYADVVSGAPYATVHGKALAGKVVVMFGGKHGLLAKHHRAISEASPHVAGSAVSTDRFGSAVAVGDLTADHRADVIVGDPGATAAKQPAGGAVYIFDGTKSGFTTRHSQRLTQATKGIPGAAVSGSELGTAVTTLPAAKAPGRHLLVGVPDKHKGGLVLVLHSGSSGVTGKHARAIKDSSPGDGFGSVFAA